jgi:hypothetical protein
VPRVEQQHADAILGLLRTALVNPVLPVHDGEVPKEPETPELPYVLVYLYTTRPDGTSLKNESDRAVTQAILHCAGANAVAARAVAGRVADAILDVKPTIPGRVCWPIRDDGSLPPDRDDTTGHPVMDQIVNYRLESVPA